MENGKQPYYSNALGQPVPKPHISSQIASPINLLNPDRYEFYTFNNEGELVKRLMTLEEIQGIIAGGDSENSPYNYESNQNAENELSDVVENVQIVLKKEIEAHKNTSKDKINLDTPDVSDTWNVILPTIFGTTGSSIAVSDLVHKTTVKPTPISSSTIKNTYKTTYSTRRPTIGPFSSTKTASTLTVAPSFATTSKYNLYNDNSDFKDIFSTQKVATMETIRPDPNSTLSTPPMISSTTSKKPPVVIFEDNNKYFTNTLNSVTPTRYTFTTIDNTKKTTVSTTKYTPSTTNNIKKTTSTFSPIRYTSSTIDNTKKVTQNPFDIFSSTKYPFSTTDNTKKTINSFAPTKNTFGIFDNTKKTTPSTSYTFSTVDTAKKTTPVYVGNKNKITTTSPVGVSTPTSFLEEEKVAGKIKPSSTQVTVTRKPSTTTLIPLNDLIKTFYSQTVMNITTESPRNYTRIKEPTTTKKPPKLNIIHILLRNNSVMFNVSTTTNVPTANLNGAIVSAVNNKATVSTPIKLEYKTPNVQEKLEQSTKYAEHKITTPYFKETTTALPNLIEDPEIFTSLKDIATTIWQEIYSSTSKSDYATETQNTDQYETGFYTDTPTTTESLLFKNAETTTELPTSFYNGIDDNFNIFDATTSVPTTIVLNDLSESEKNNKIPIKSTKRPVIANIGSTKPAQSTKRPDVEKIGSTKPSQLSTDWPIFNLDSFTKLESVKPTEFHLPSSSEIYLTPDDNIKPIYNRFSMGQTVKPASVATKATSVVTKPASVTTKPASVATKPTFAATKPTSVATTEDEEFLITRYTTTLKPELELAFTKPKPNINTMMFVHNLKPIQDWFDTTTKRKPVSETFKPELKPTVINKFDTTKDPAFEASTERYTPSDIKTTIGFKHPTFEAFKIHTTGVKSTTVPDVTSKLTGSTNGFLSNRFGATETTIKPVKITTAFIGSSTGSLFKGTGSPTEKITTQPVPTSATKKVTEQIKVNNTPVMFFTSTIAKPAESSTVVLNLNKNSSVPYRKTEDTWKLVSTVAPPGGSSNTTPIKKVPTTTEMPVDQYQQTSKIDLSLQGNFGVQHLSEDMYTFSKLYNELALKFWNSLSTNYLSPERSVIVSPFGVISTLSMIFLGARGSTYDEMNELLKLDDIVTFNPHLKFKEVTESVTTRRTSAIVRELYSDNTRGKILDFYKERVRSFYDGHVEEVDFRFINDVVRRRTNLMIRKQTRGYMKQYLGDTNFVLRGPLAALSMNIFQVIFI